MAASPSTGEIWGVGDGVRVQPETWMASIPQRQDALWACGSTGQPCAGKWRLLEGPSGVQVSPQDAAHSLGGSTTDAMSQLYHGCCPTCSMGK